MQINPISNTMPVNAQKLSVTDQLEQSFLEEMLKYAMPKPAEGQFSGGYGEEHFSTFLTREYAELMAARMDLGLKVFE